MLTHRNLAWASHAYAAEVDAVAPGDAIIACGTAQPRLRALCPPACRTLGRECRAGVGRLRARRDFRAVLALDAALDVRGAHHDQAPRREQRRLRSGRAPHADLGRRADVCRGRAEGDRPLRLSPGANLRPGRKSDDDHVSLQARNRRSRSSALGRKARLRRPALCLRRSEGRRSRGSRASRRSSPAKFSARATW